MSAATSRQRRGLLGGTQLLLSLVLGAGCATPTPRVIPLAVPRAPEAVSLLGRPLYPRAFDQATLRRLEQDLAGARARYEADPMSADAAIWLGRRLAYLDRYQEAIRVFSVGIERNPNDPRLYRHRGHRYITTRQFDRAIDDLERAAALIRDLPDEVEPDGAPNRFGIPTSTLHFNVWYHLALAHYLRGDHHLALPPWEAALSVSTNDDMRVAASDWLYMTLRRMGREAEAERVLERIRPEMDVIENHAYHRRLLMYRGEIAPETLLHETDADELELITQGYGVASWNLFRGDAQRAREIFQRLVSGSYWPAFGFIAAEAELTRP